MKYLQSCIFFTCLFFTSVIQAQANHFIYIQADNKQPFYVKLDKKIYSSSVSGYLVVAKLPTGVYEFVVGFPQNEWPEQTIRCAVNDKDYGYLLKNFGEKGWGFFDLQTLNVLMAASNNQPGKKADPPASDKTDAFSSMLSTVVNDPTIKQNDPVPVKEEVKKPVPNPANPLPPKAADAVKDKMPETETAEPAENKAAIIKKINSKTNAGMEMMYIDTAEGRRDTIRVFIAAEKDAFDTNTAKTITVVKPGSFTSAIEFKDTTVKEEKEKEAGQKFSEPVKVAEVKQASLPKKEEKKPAEKFIDLVVPDKQEVKETKPDSSLVQQGVSKSPMINSDCKNFATGDDFLKLRKKMAAANNEEAMISTAKKVFKSKCFTTEQVKNLSTLFLKDAERYGFFDMAYPFVSDSQNFSTLQGQLTDGYYIDRFKVMIRH